METKDAIKLIREMEKDYIHNFERGIDKGDESWVDLEKGKIDEIVKMLNRGEAHEKMWEGLRNFLDEKGIGYVEEAGMEVLEQKYLKED